MHTPWVALPPLAERQPLRRGGRQVATAALYRIDALPDVGDHTPVSAEAINQHGGVTGVAYVHPEEWAAYVHLDGRTQLLPGGRFAHGHSLNDRGDVVGTLGGKACWWPRGCGREMLAALHRAASINNRGQIAGTARFDGIHARAALFSDGELVDLGTLGGATSVATGVNDAGQVTGYAALASGEAHAFLWQPALGMRDLGTLGGADSRAVAINAVGQVIGRSNSDDGEAKAFLRSEGGMAALPTVGEKDLTALALARDGEVVGRLTGARGRWTASLTRGGRTHKLISLLDASGADWQSLDIALGINDAGQIAGVGQRWREAGARAFVATPLAR